MNSFLLLSLFIWEESLFGNQANKALLPWETVKNPAKTTRTCHGTYAFQSLTVPFFPGHVDGTNTWI